MSVLSELQISADMARQDVLNALFTQKKKWINRQNAADLNRRTEAEKKVQIIGEIQELVEKTPDSFDLWLVLEAYDILYPLTKTEGEVARVLKATVSGDVHQTERLALAMLEFKHPRSKAWTKRAVDSGIPSFEQVVRQTLMKYHELQVNASQQQYQQSQYQQPPQFQQSPQYQYQQQYGPATPPPFVPGTRKENSFTRARDTFSSWPLIVKILCVLGGLAVAPYIICLFGYLMVAMMFS